MLRELVLSEVDIPTWRAVVAKALADAAAGDAVARAWLTPWVMGAEPKEIDVNFTGGVMFYLPERRPILLTDPDRDPDS